MSELLTNLDESEILTLMDDLNQQPPESVAQQPSEQTPVAQHPQTRLTILAAVLLAFLLSIIAYYFGTTQTQPPPQNQIIPKPSPTPTQTTDQTVSTERTASANWKTLSIDKLSFKIPPKWVQNDYSYEKPYADKGIALDLAIREPGDLDSPNAFVVGIKKNRTINQEKTQTFDPNSNIKEQNVVVSGRNGIIFEGLSIGGVRGQIQLKMTLFNIDNNVYYFIDENTFSNHQQYFDQILSTFRFTK